MVNTKNEPVEDKFEKALLEFKNKIKRDGEKEKKTKDQDKDKDKRNVPENGVG